MNVTTVTQTARMMMAITPHRGVFGVLVELVYVWFEVLASQVFGRRIRRERCWRGHVST